nr:hypothetical protein [Phormidium ambiguum]
MGFPEIRLNLAGNGHFDRRQQIVHRIVQVAIATQNNFLAALRDRTKSRERDTMNAF